jgi:GNAT superfamily N-acetyltransferase
LLARALSFLRRRFGINLCRVLARRPGGMREGGGGQAGLEYRLARESELLDAALDPALEIEPAAVRSALRCGDLCVGCFEGRRLVGYLWYAFGSAPHSGGLRVEFDSAAARYAYRAFTHPAYRGKGIGRSLFLCAGEICPRHGRTQDLCLIYFDNPPSRRAARNAGWLEEGYAGYFLWRGLFFGFRSPGARRYDVRFSRPSASSAPGLRISPRP